MELVYYGQGTLSHASLSVLKQLADAGKKWKTREILLTRADDLGSVVCMAFQALHPATYEALHGVSEPAVLFRFWAHYLSKKPWKEMVQAASECDYEQLKLFINAIM